MTDFEPTSIRKVEKWLEAIEKYAESDDESAHYEQDELQRYVLRRVAAGHANSKELAKLALKADRIQFSRWYA